MVEHLRHRAALWAILACSLLFAAHPNDVRGDVVLSDNLGAASAGTEAAAGSTWLTASFGTDASSYAITSVTLLLANPIAGTAELDIYRDGGLQPGALMGTLTSPGSYSSTLAETTFTSSGISVAANSTFWVVLKAASGEFDWSWTSSNSGTGAGFQDTWGSSFDGGTTWYCYSIYPTQMRVDAAVTPEPTSIALMGSGAFGLLWSWTRWTRRRRPSSVSLAASCPK
jgi:hypothetical protein